MTNKRGEYLFTNQVILKKVIFAIETRVRSITIVAVESSVKALGYHNEGHATNMRLSNIVK